MIDLHGDGPLHVTVMAQRPVAGSVQADLSPPLTSEQAVQVVAACLRDTFAAVSEFAALDGNVRTVALVDDTVDGWVPDGFDVVAQRGGSTAERRANALADLGPGVVVDMNTPSIGRHLSAIVDAVRSGSDAIGATHDGTLWAIALADPAAGALGSQASGDHVVQSLESLGRSVLVLPAVHALTEFGDIAPIVADVPGGHLASVAISLLNGRWG